MSCAATSTTPRTRTAAALAIHAGDPEALAGLDAGKLNRVNLARRNFLKPWQEYDERPRAVVCGRCARPGLGRQGIPELPIDEAVESSGR